MFVLGNILFAVARVLDTLLTLYFWVVIISALLTWSGLIHIIQWSAR